MRLWSLVELAGFCVVAAGVGGQFGLWWGLVVGGVLLAVWAGVEELRRS